MTAEQLRLLLHFAGQHQVLTAGIAIIVGIVAINISAHMRGKMSWRTLHKRPHEYGAYALAGTVLYHAFNLFTQSGGCQ